MSKTHKCVESTSCTCSISALEPNDNCPVHSSGNWPPRCEICGRFMRYDSRIKLANNDQASKETSLGS